MQTIKLRINTYGKDNRWGENVYKVGSAYWLLVEKGWKIARRTRSYYYLQAPEGEGSKRPIIEVDIPTQEEVEALAYELHARGERYRGKAFGWPVEYTPERSGVHQSRVVNVFEGSEQIEERPFHYPATFRIGEPLAWYASARWDEGPDAKPRFGVSDENVVEVVK